MDISPPRIPLRSKLVMSRINSASRRMHHHKSTNYPYGGISGYGYSSSSGGLGGIMIAFIAIITILSGNLIPFIVVAFLFLFLWKNRRQNQPTGPSPLNHPVPMNYRNADGTENKSSIRKRSYKKRSNPKYCEACSVAILPNAPFCGQCGTST